MFCKKHWICYNPAMEISRKKVAFIAHSYHKKTKSCDFMVDYLKEFFDVELIYDEEWETGKQIDWKIFSEDEYHAVIIWQMFPRKEDFEKINNSNIVYFPMYDQVYNWHFNQWKICKNIKIVSFSLTLHKYLQKLGLNSLYVQYFIEPKGFFPGNVNEVFFWQRLSKININTVKKILKGNNVKIHVHKTVDPGQIYVPPTKEDENNFCITYSEWFDKKEDMQDFIKSKGIYISPRYLEGIGMGFLEAIAQGKLVIANNKPTMKEYIQNGKTGYLCNFKFPRRIELKNIEQIQKNTYDFAQKGYAKWLQDRKNIIEFIDSAPQKGEFKLWVKLLMPFLSIERKKILRIKFGSNPNLEIFGRKLI